MSLTERLIQIVERHPILYNLWSNDYRNLRKREKVWDEIGKELNHDGQELKKKWKNIRDCYQKHLKSMVLKSGQTTKGRYKTWQWAEHMEFCKPYLSVDEKQAVSETHEASSYSPNTPENENSNHPNITNGTQEIIEKTTDAPIQKLIELNGKECNTMGSTSTRLKSRKRHTEQMSKRGTRKIIKCFQSKKEMDATDLIFLSYSKTIKTFCPAQQALVKFRFAQIMMEEEMKHIGETSTPDITNPEASPIYVNLSSSSNSPCSNLST